MVDTSYRRCHTLRPILSISVVVMDFLTNTVIVGKFLVSSAKEWQKFISQLLVSVAHCLLGNSLPVLQIICDKGIPCP